MPVTSSRARSTRRSDRRSTRRSTRRSGVLLALGTTVALVAGACLPDEPTSAGSGQRPEVRVDESLGVVRIAPGDTIDVRVVLDGPEDAEGLAAVLEAAFRTAVEDFGVVQQGFRVSLGPAVITDCSRQDGARVGTELAAQDTLVAVLGPQCTATLQGMQGPLTAAGMAVITSRPTGVTLTVGADGLPGQDRAEGVWRTSPSGLVHARAAARHAAEEFDLRRAATLRGADLESSGLAAAFRDEFQALGGTVVVDVEVDPAVLGPAGGSGDGSEQADDEADEQTEQVDEQAAAIEALLDAVAAGNVDVAFFALGPEELLVIADAWSSRSRLNAATRFTTADAGVARFLEDESSLDHFFAAPVLEADDVTSAVTGMSSAQTLERVSSLSGVPEPSGWWTYAYDAATLLLKALEDTSIIDADGSLLVSRAELRENLARTSFSGLSGNIACEPLGDCSGSGTAIHAHDDPSVTDLSQMPIAARIAPTGTS